MEYTIAEFAKLANLSSRTLRYYDQIGLLKPKKINASGYRIYSSEQADILQQIMFYRSFGMELSKISEIVNHTDFNLIHTLKEHRNRLLDEKKLITLQLELLERSIEAAEGKITMTDDEKFEGLKQKIIDENESNYGTEIRDRFGDEVMDASNRKFLGLSKNEYRHADELGKKLIELFLEAYHIGDPSCKKAQDAAQLHKEWLSCYWTEYSEEAHAGIVKMYVEDERFRSYYDKYQTGLAEFLRDAVLIFLNM